MQTNRSGSSRAGGVGTTLSLVLLGTLLTAAVTMFCYQRLKPVIEQDLTTSVTAALQGTGVDNISVEGQDVFLSGVVNSDIARVEAEQTAASVYGVSRVINNLTIDGATAIASASAEQLALTQTDDTNSTKTANSNTANSQLATNSSTQLVIDNAATGAAPSTLTIVVNDGSVNTQGIVSDDATIQRINTALAGKFGKGNVKDDMSSFEGSAAPAWIDGMLSMIDQLDGIANPIVKVTGSDLVLAGTVTAEDIRRAKISTAERLLGSELSVIDNLTVKPDATPVQNKQVADNIASKPVKKRPASMGIQSTNGEITLTGFVANDNEANALRTGLKNLFGQDGYTDNLTIDNTVASAEWIDDALIVTSEIRDVNDFGLNISSGQMLLNGVVDDRDIGRDLSIAATEIAGNKLDVLNSFSVNNSITDSDEDLLAQSLMQELDALPTKNIVFNKNSTTLTSSAQEVLDDVAAAIMGYSDLVVEIAGHTDSSGDAVRNLKLSKERATAVRNYLVEQNVPANRLSPIGYGETAPISDNETREGRAANRRIEFNL